MITALPQLASRRLGPWKPADLADGLLAAGEGALDCDGHVPVSDGLVADDGHEGPEHKHDEADRHRRTKSGQHHGKHEQRRSPGKQGDVEWVKGADQVRVQREERDREHSDGHRTVSTVATAPMCAS